MRRSLATTLPLAGEALGLAVLAAATVLAFDVYASPGFALSGTLLKLCGL